MATEISPDGRDLRLGRRQRALAQMEAHDIDVLVLGRQANVRYVTGAPQLWIGGTRPFGPVCVMLRGTGEIYLMSTDDEGVPEEIGRDRLYGLVKELRSRGVSIVYISHRLGEVKELADRVLVLRDGENAGENEQEYVDEIHGCPPMRGVARC